MVPWQEGAGGHKWNWGVGGRITGYKFAGKMKERLSVLEGGRR